MRSCFHFIFAALAALISFSLPASELPHYAPKNTGIIIFADMKRISDSRLVRKIFSENSELQEVRDEVDQEIRKHLNASREELFDSEVCFFIDVIDSGKDVAWQILFVNHSGCAKKIFDVAADDRRREDDPAFTVGKTGDMPFARSQKWILLQADSATLHFSLFGKDSAHFVPLPLVKNVSPLAGEIDTCALLGVAVDLEKVTLSDDLLQDENFRAMLRGLVKVTFHFTEKDDTLIFRTVAVYRDEKSAADAKAVADHFNAAVKNALADPSAEVDRRALQLQKLTVSDSMTRDGVRLIGTSVIDRDLAIGFFRALLAQTAQ